MSHTCLTTAGKIIPHRFLRLRKRNIRFLCGSRRNRERGLMKPAAAAAVEAEEDREAAEEAHVLQSLRLKDPLVQELPMKRWRTQWFPSFARRSLAPLIQATRRCDAIVEASPVATRRWQLHFRRESREAAALQLHQELMRARRQLKDPGLFRALAGSCPLSPRLQYLFVDAREAASVIRMQKLLRSLVNRHRRYRRELENFRSCCNQAAVAAATAGPSVSVQYIAAAQAIADKKRKPLNTNPGQEHPTRATLRHRKPLRVLIVGVPNVGKSKIANCLVGKKVARSYRWPGVTQSVNIHRQPAILTRGEDPSRLFEVIDTPGFIPVHPGKSPGKRSPGWTQHEQLQKHLGTAKRQRQLDLELFFDFSHPRPSADELALLGAFHMLPHSCLFTVEEAAVALGDAFFRIKEQLPEATDISKVMTRYQLNPLHLNKETSGGVQLLLKVSRAGEGLKSA
ncbi:uncharacterized protein LOC34620367 [Cyclospora cayetanensis]|uniref:Uncharacterized protein LOC34620367 n=1 Tax=Cyclospora cayetanensis TaxID=88456 RepID=A0A6P6RQY8_9EIME|nr:uncharacterized protein LOC34620367 [Cyclospora cayetanensis]